ncbi:hypothetical protein BX616_008412, partial [Lobosporangium transversale]
MSSTPRSANLVFSILRLNSTFSVDRYPSDDRSEDMLPQCAPTILSFTINQNKPMGPGELLL